MNVEDLLTKATKGHISKSEFEEVSQVLSEGKGDSYGFLLIIGRACDLRYQMIVERYLDSPDDPMLARLSLQILCQYWGLGCEYVTEIKEFINGVEWDEEDEVKDMALSCCASVFKKQEEANLVKSVYDVFIDQNEDSISRITAYGSLAVLAGLDIAKLAQPLEFAFDLDVDKKVLKYAEKIIEKKA